MPVILFGVSLAPWIVTDYLIIKLLWSVILLTLTCLCSVWLIFNVFSYFKYDVITVTKRNFDFPAPFPTVTVCNKNMFTTDFALELLVRQINASKLNDLLDPLFLKNISQESDYKYIFHFYKQISILMAGLINTKPVDDGMRKKIGYSLSETLINCNFGGTICNEDDFISVFDSTYGNCFKFNSGFNSSGQQVDLKTTRLTDKFFGLSLVLFAGVNLDLRKLYTDYGLVIRIDNSSYRVSTDDGIVVSPGFETHIGINDRIYSYRLPRPYSNCDIEKSKKYEFNSEYYNLIIDSNTTYKQKLCTDLCIQKILVSKCNCSYSLLFNLYNNVESCSSIEQYGCIVKVYYDYIPNNYMNEKCLPSCPFECYQSEMKTSISFSQLVPDLFINLFDNRTNLFSAFPNRTITAEGIKGNLVKVNIYYESLLYTEISETPSMDIFLLLSNIGGCISLFLGVSLLSGIEIIEVMLGGLIFMCNKIKINNLK